MTQIKRDNQGGEEMVTPNGRGEERVFPGQAWKQREREPGNRRGECVSGCIQQRVSLRAEGEKEED